ncbi:uncharacterized protein LOC135332856 [Halichondria panicea]|uniref:uncharacterized protein LOC135332856 n=1 Tax=Halichondria panicea TaxID=6063 RepID=UPI00312B9D91
MSCEPTSLKREGTMQVTAQEGEAFLESQGMKVTDDDAKTRAQKEKLEEITTPSNEDKPRIPREGTMAVTAKEGKELLGDGSYEKTRQQTAASNEETSANGDESKPRIPRDNTMVVTAQEGEQLLDGEKREKTRAQTAATKEEQTPPKVKRATTIAQTAEASTHILGDEERGKTRSETRKISLSDEEKPAVKRANTMEQTAKEGEEFLAREAKRAKLDGENGEAQEEVKAES